MQLSEDSISIHKALADETRYRIYQTLTANADGLTVDQLARRIGVHRNTVRPHLLRLEDAGLAVSASEERPTAGRPRRIYRGIPIEAVKPEDEDYRLLADILLSMLSEQKLSPERQAAVALDWGRYIARQNGGVKPGHSLSIAEAFGKLSECLEAIGFATRVTEIDRQHYSLELTTCPFMSLAKEHPELVCQIHKGVIDGLMAEFGLAGSVYQLDVLNEDGWCAAGIRVG